MPISTLQVSNSEKSLVTRHGYVYNIGIHLNCPILGRILKKYIGKDISHLFEPQKPTLKLHYDEYTGELCEMVEGKSVTVQPGLKWWETIEPCDVLSANEFYIQIKNTLTEQSEIKLVCIEDKIYFILAQYDLSRLSVKHANRCLDLDMTVEENNIIFQFDLPTIYLVFVAQ